LAAYFRSLAFKLTLLATLPAVSAVILTVEHQRGTRAQTPDARVEGDHSDRVRSIVDVSEGLALGLVLLSVWLTVAMGRGISRNVQSLLGSAERVRREGDFSARALVGSSDEVGLLAEAFNEVLGGVEARDVELKAYRESLESLVAQRTVSLWKRTEHMRVVLDTVEQGLVTLDPEGNICGGRSRAFDLFFGVPAANERYFERIAGADAKLSLTLELDWAQIAEGLMPLEVAVNQAERRIQHGGRHLALHYSPITDSATFKGALLTITDVTAEVLAQRAEAGQREEAKLLARMMKDRAGFQAFMAEGERIVASIRNGRFRSVAETLQAVHTLKGNAALSDATSVADAAHAVESAFAEREPGGEAKAIGALASAWQSLVERVASVVGPDGPENFEVSRADLEGLLAAHRENRVLDIEQFVASIQGDTIGKHFSRVAAQLRNLSMTLGKGEPEITVAGAEIRFSSVRLVSFWAALAHVVRNVADHGLQSEEERIRRGKPPRNRVHLTARSEPEAWVVEIADDGRGIDWHAVAARAKAMGWPYRTRAELAEAVFAPGFSTAETTTETSGRGMGMFAVLEACRSLGGDCLLESELGVGTKYTFILPKSVRTH